MLVVLGITFNWIIPLVAFIMDIPSDSGSVQSVTVLRAFRVFRLVRVVRRNPIFRDAWLLVRGLTDSFSTLFWTVIIIVFIIYAFSLFGAMTIGKGLQDILQRSSNIEEKFR